MQRWRIVPAIASLALVAAVLSGCGGRPAAAASEIEITLRFSRFHPVTTTVPAGVPVKITLRNEDPIEHEWIVGPAEVHARHRSGSEPYHDQVPTEVTLPALSTRVTTVTFARPGEYEFICHLPGHESYGMKGVLRAVAP